MTYLNAKAVPINYQPMTLDIVPAGKKLIVNSIIAAAYPNSGVTQTITVCTSDGAVLISNYSLAQNTAANLLAAPIVLLEGQSLVLRNDDPTSASSLDSQALSTNAVTLLVNSAGTTLVAVSQSQILRSTDEGKSWTRHAYYVPNTPLAAVYIGSSFFLYLSATSALVSTDDGLTWTVTAVTNAPINSGVLSPLGRILKKGSTYVGVSTSSTQLVSSTDGVTWSNLGIVIPAGSIKSIAFTGTNYLIPNGAAVVYTSTDATSWTAVTHPLTGTVSYCTSDGAGRVVIGNGTLVSTSSNHGSTFGSTNGIASAGIWVWTGVQFLANYTTSGYVAIIQTGVIDVGAVSFQIERGQAPDLMKTCISPTKMYHMPSTYLIKSYSLDMLELRYGVSFLVSAVEVL